MTGFMPAHLGANAVRIERPQPRDAVRHFGLKRDGITFWRNARSDGVAPRDEVTVRDVEDHTEVVLAESSSAPSGAHPSRGEGGAR